LYCSLLWFFFFQAEDGIRDFHVTGVQTCALPISDSASAYRWADNARYGPPSAKWCRPPHGYIPPDRDKARPGPNSHYLWACTPRSEERRVGKERKSRWTTA